MEQRTATNTPGSCPDPQEDRQSFIRESERDGLTTHLSLPTDRPRPPASDRAAWKPVALRFDFARTVGRLSGSDKDILPTLLAAFTVLLHRYSGETQIVVGIPPECADWGQAGIPAGSVTIAQPLWIDLSGDPEFRDLEAHVRRQWCDAGASRRHAFDPSPPIDSHEEIQRSAPKFQFLFSFSSAASTISELFPVRENGNCAGHKLAGTELHLHVVEQEGGLDCALEYDAALFDEETVRRMLGHYQVLLQEIMANSGERISTLPLLTKAERRQLLEEWSQPVASAPSPSEEFYHEAFAAQAAKTPDAVAIIVEERQLTFREVDVQSSQLAHFLRRHGVGPDVLVGICLERSPELVVGLLAILKAGGAFVPLEPSYPAAQLSGLLAETRPAVLITQSQLLARLQPHEAVAICLDAERDAIAAESTSSPDVRVTGENVAMVMFSSGSTGKPKAIPRCHPTRSPGAWKRPPFQLGQSDRHVLKSSLDSTLLVREVFWPLLTGARMIIAGPQENRDTASLLRLLIDHKITIITLVPSLLRRLVAEEGLEACTSLRHVTCFGEPLPADVEARFCQRLPAVLSISYGTTEAPTLAFRQCRGTDSRPLGNLGYRYGNSQIYILDARLQPVPIGVPGELVAGGPSLATGYLNRREQTDERFIPHPFSKESGARLYRTGDRARWRSDGSLEFIGRLDDQIKIRGYRVEPAEVEAALSRHPAVREAVVAARPSHDGENQLVAYLVAGSPGLTVSELRGHLAQSLPAQMIPTIFVGLERLPRRPNGKVERKALPSHEFNRLESGQQFVAPRTSIEETLADLWCDVMGLEHVGVHDNFFDLGGHSLLALQLFARIEGQFHKRLPLALLFQQGTVAGIARHLTGEAENACDVSMVELQPGAARHRRLFAMPTIGGELMAVHKLLRHLSATTPVYGLQPDLSAHVSEKFATFENTAASYVETLRQFQPRGPYALVGYSYGGMLAYEVARQIAEQGEVVDLLAVLDTGPGNRGQSLGTSQRLLRWLRILKNLPRWLIDDARFSPRDLYWRTRQSLRRVAPPWLLRWIGKSSPVETRVTLGDLGFPTQNRELVAAHVQALSVYMPQQYPGVVTLFRSRTRPLFSGSPGDLGWTRFALGGVDLRLVPGHHDSILDEPHVRIVARELQQCLDRLSIR